MPEIHRAVVRYLQSSGHGYVTHPRLQAFDYASSLALRQAVSFFFHPLTTRLNSSLSELESAILLPGGSFEKCHSWIKEIEDRQISKAARIGRHTFRDVFFVKA